MMGRCLRSRPESIASVRHDTAKKGERCSSDLSKSEGTMAGSNVADRAANFSKDFWPPVGIG